MKIGISCDREDGQLSEPQFCPLVAPGREVEHMQRDLPRRLVLLKVRQRWKLDISPRGAGYKRDTDCYKRVGKLPSQRAGALKMVQNKIGSLGLV